MYMFFVVTGRICLNHCASASCFLCLLYRLKLYFTTVAGFIGTRQDWEVQHQPTVSQSRTMSTPNKHSKGNYRYRLSLSHSISLNHISGTINRILNRCQQPGYKYTFCKAAAYSHICRETQPEIYDLYSSTQFLRPRYDLLRPYRQQCSLFYIVPQ